MKIDFVNHASVLISHGSSGLLCDPWLDGRVFNKGWELVVPTQFRPQDFARVSHIWFSHEHPDHFHPPSLRQIPPELRSRITVLYQATKDRRVVRFCESLGFAAVMELEPHREYDLEPELSVRCMPIGQDSWIYVRTPNATLLNLNDCELWDPRDAGQLANLLGRVDVLLTQFSYASWAGPDVASRRRTAANVLDRLRMQARAFSASHVIPFASFVWFCHEENFDLNDAVNHIGDVAAFIARETSAGPVVLYPGDAWSVGAAHDPSSAIERYALRHADVVRGAAQNLEPVHSVSEDRLRDGSEEFAKSLRSRSNRLLLRMHTAGTCAMNEARRKGRSRWSATVPAVLSAATLRVKRARVHVHDLGKCYEVALGRPLREVALRPEDCDITLSSDSLDHVFTTEWGGNTLEVNGRFRAPDADRRHRFFDLTRPARRLTAGYAPLQIRTLLPILLDRLLSVVAPAAS